MKFFDAPATRAPLRFEQLVPALREAFARGVQVPARHVHRIEVPDAPAGTVLIMPAWNEQGFFGLKTINIFPGNSAHGLPGLHATYLLHDARTGVPLALMDGNEITAHRTAAASALGAAFLARADAHRLLILGTGRIARLLPAAHACVRPIDTVRVWNHRPEGAEALAARWRDEGWAAEAAPDLRTAVAEADVICCATLSERPLIQGGWLRAGSHLDLIGSFTPAMREAAPDCFAGARTYMDTPEALLKAGDLLDAIAAGTLEATAIQGTLEDLCRGTRPGRLTANERTVFKAVGSALEDLTAAVRVWQAASTNGPVAVTDPLPRTGPA